MPDVAAGFERAELFVVGGDLDAVQYPLRGNDLIRAHHKQHAIGGEHAVLGENV